MGYDPVDHAAFLACSHSLRAHATIPVEIVPIWDRPLRQAEIYWRTHTVDGNGQQWGDDGKPFSSAFSFARFATPIVAEYTEDIVLFMDPDMLWRGDIADLLDDTYSGKALWCVQHDHTPSTTDLKMYGCAQTLYHRKNWSSFMLMRPSLCRDMNIFKLNHWTGGDLHALKWLDDDMIGALDERWNWLEGWSTSDDPKVAHFTRGTPDMSHAPKNMPYTGEWWEAYHAALVAEVNKTVPLQAVV
jgi:hypothetical protein